MPAAVAQTITTTTSKNKEVQKNVCKKTTRTKEALQNNQKIKQCFKKQHVRNNSFEITITTNTNK